VNRLARHLVAQETNRAAASKPLLARQVPRAVLASL